MRFTRFFSSALILASLLPGFSAQAAMPNMDTLIKSSSRDTVYWYANDGKRYVFPNIKTYYTWFSSDDFARVHVMTDAELGTIPLGGNVTYRGGAKLVKITTDPKVYAVSRYGVLRWVPSEDIVRQLYGASWAQYVEDIPDAFFINYVVGAPISQTSDFNVSTEYNGVTHPSHNLRGIGFSSPSYPVAPLSSLLGRATITASNQAPRIGDTSNLYVQVSNLIVPSSDIVIDIYDEYGTLLRSCDRQTSCLHPLQIANGFTRRAYYARVRHLTSGQTIESNRLVIDPYQTTPNTTEAVRIFFNRNTYVATSELFTIYAEVGALNSSGPLYNISLYDQDNLLLGSCTHVRSCNAQTSLRSGQSSRAYYARATRIDGSGTIESSSATMYPTGNTLSNGTLTIATDRTVLNDNDRAIISTELRNYTGSTSPLRTELYDERTGSVVGTCTGTLYCYFTIQSTQLTAQNGTRFYAVVTNGSGERVQSSNTSMLTLSSNATGYGPLAQNFTVNLSPSQPRIGEQYTVSTYMSGLRVPVDQITIELYDSQLGIRQRCVGTTSCGYTANEWQTVSKDIYALLRTASGEVLRSDSWRLSTAN
jgi:hypothetical protein